MGAWVLIVFFHQGTIVEVGFSSHRACEAARSAMQNARIEERISLSVCARWVQSVQL